jgi:hypothetical protein
MTVTALEKALESEDPSNTYTGADDSSPNPTKQTTLKNSKSLKLNKEPNSNCDYTFAISSRSSSPKSTVKNILTNQLTLNKINLSIRDLKKQDIHQIIQDEQYFYAASRVFQNNGQ